MVGSKTDILKEKALLLISRERELQNSRRAFDRQSAWLSLARQLPEIATLSAELPQICQRFSERVIALLRFQAMAFFEFGGGTQLTPVARFGEGDKIGGHELSPEALDAFSAAAGGVFNDTKSALAADLAQASGLLRFVWCRVDRTPLPELLVLAGFDRTRAAMNQAIPDSDGPQFERTGHELALLLSNARLIREVAAEKLALEALNSDLERRVQIRTEELAGANRELARSLSDLQAWEHRLLDDMQQARAFQEGVLPVAQPMLNFEFATVYRPLELVGGDMFDVWQPAPGQLRLFLADATGHGVQAALRTILLKAEYDRIKLAHLDPSDVLQELSNHLARLFPNAEMMCTASCIDLAFSEGVVSLTYANASHPGFFVWSNGQTPREIYADGPFLGLEGAAMALPMAHALQPGDLLLATSDGLIEQTDATARRFDEVLRDLRLPVEIGAQVALHRVMALFDAFRGGQAQLDDVSAIVVRICAPSSGHADDSDR